jgi:hypothetical protein
MLFSGGPIPTAQELHSIEQTFKTFSRKVRFFGNIYEVFIQLKKF